MAICELCEQEVGLVYSWMKRMEGQIPFGAEPRLAITGSRCVDCRVGTGGFHHPGYRVVRNDRRPAPGAWRRRLANGGVRPAYNR